MKLRPAEPSEFNAVQSFYWQVIDLMRDKSDTVGWKKGIYPADSFLTESIARKELYLLERDNAIAGAVVLNSEWNEGYEGLPWSIPCPAREVMVLHALAVHPALHRRGLGKVIVRDAIQLAQNAGKRTMRLDILKGNAAAERLYPGMGFQFVAAKKMFYEDTGWTDFMMYELLL